MRTESARSFARLASTTKAEELIAILDDMAQQTRAELISDGVPDAEITSEFEIDVRYAGQAIAALRRGTRCGGHRGGTGRAGAGEGGSSEGGIVGREGPRAAGAC